MVTGDRAAVAEEVGRQLGVDRVYAEQSPEGKLDVVRALREQPELTPVVMVGDGVNDAPALALADVGIAMGAAGATVASETADAVIMRDRIDGVVEAIQIGRRSLAIARQSMIAGIGPLARRDGRSRPPVCSRRSPAHWSRKRSTSPSSSTHCARCVREAQRPRGRYPRPVASRPRRHPPRPAAGRSRGPNPRQRRNEPRPVAVSRRRR